MTQSEQRKALLQELEREVIPALDRVHDELADITRGRKTARRLRYLRHALSDLCKRGSGKLYAPR